MTIPIKAPNVSALMVAEARNPDNVARALREVHAALLAHTQYHQSIVSELGTLEARVATSPLWTATKAADGAAGTTTAETLVGMLGPTAGATIASVYYVPAATLAANDSNYATIQVVRRTGGNSYTIAQTTTQTAGKSGTGNWTAWTAVPIPLATPSTPAAGVNKQLVALDAVTFNIAKTGAGVIVPAGQLVVFAS